MTLMLLLAPSIVSLVSPLYRAPTVTVADVHLRLLALELSGSQERYQVELHSTGGTTSSETLLHMQGEDWRIENGDGRRLPLGTPDEVFSRALVGSDAGDYNIDAEAPFWPEEVRQRLERRSCCGAVAVALDASWFLSELASSSFDRPILMPNATARLGLKGMEAVADLTERLRVTLRCGRVDVSQFAFVEMLRA